MNSRLSKIIIAVVAIAAVFGLSVASNHTKPQPKQQSAPKTQEVKKAPPADVSYRGAEGMNALELLKKQHKVETKSYEGLGELVTSIDGSTADGKHFWAFYVNGQQSQVGASSYTLQAADKITWKLEEIK